LAFNVQDIEEHHMAEQTILVTGATGTAGTQTVRQLAEAGHSVRALVRDRAKAAKLDPRAEIVVGDLTDPESLRPAFEGVDKVFVISNGWDLHVMEGAAYDAAKAAGAKHIVKLSGRTVDWPELAGTTTAEWHSESERLVQASGLTWTILRPGFFFSNLLQFGVMQRGGLFLPVGDGKDTPIDPLDIAAVAVKTLTEPGHEGKIYEMTGPERVGFQEIVERIAAFTGAKLTFADTPPEDVIGGLIQSGMPQRQAEAIIKYFAIVKAGKMYVEPTVGQILGRPARNLEDWMRANAAELRS
jgi:uncharacterized protein YbjT (DUF2867 family)